MSSKRVTKADLIDAVRLETKYEKYVIQEIFDSILKQTKNSLESGSSIELRGFGTFELRLRKERKKARNPKTGECLSVPPHYVVVFRSGRDLKKVIWDLPCEE